MSGYKKEKYVKEVMEKEYGKKFIKRRILIGEYEREIDLYSQDGEIAVQVKSGSDFSSSGRINPYRLAEICIDYLILMVTQADKKILILTDARMYEQLKREIKGLPLAGVELRLIEC
jgi:hypothetical protein